MGKPKGTTAAVVIFLRQNPRYNNRELAMMLGLSLRRVQQITKKIKA